jgi:hypothetical protein
MEASQNRLTIFLLILTISLLPLLFQYFRGKSQLIFGRPEIFHTTFCKIFALDNFNTIIRRYVGWINIVIVSNLSQSVSIPIVNTLVSV